MEMTDTNAGWGWPEHSPKAHWFDVNTATSLCGGWTYTGPRDRAPAPGPDDCRACVRMLQERRERSDRV